MFSQGFLTSYDRNALIEEIRRVDRRTPDGHLTQKEFHRFSRVSVSTIVSHFGSWAEALHADGLDQRYSGIVVSPAMRRQPGRQWTREMIIEHLRDIAKTAGIEKLTQSIFRKHANPTFAIRGYTSR